MGRRKAGLLVSVAAAVAMASGGIYVASGQNTPGAPTVPGGGGQCSSLARDLVPSPQPGVIPKVDARKATAVLNCLPVKGRASKTGYDRVGKYGRAWIDVDHNGLDTRTDILLRDLTDVAFTPGKKKEVASGTLADPYTGRIIRFLKGTGANNDGGVQVDHLIPLELSFQLGAAEWPQDKRIAFANDPVNLLLVSSESNRQKSSSDIASWVPKNKAYRCVYAEKQLQVMGIYGLWVTPPAKDAYKKYLSAC